MTDLNVITAQRGHVQALAFAAKGGSALSNLLSGIATTKAAEREGALHMALFLEMNFTSDEQHAIPQPGSKKEDAGNKPYDRYTVDVKTDNGMRKVPGSWFTDVVKSTQRWADIQQRIKWLGGDTDGMPDDIAAMGAGERATEIKKLRQFIADMRTGLTKGAMLFLHVETIAAINPARIAVKMPYKSRFVLGADGERIKTGEGNEYVTEMYVTGSNIRLIDPEKEFEDKVFSVSEFLALNPDKLVGPSNTQTIVTLEKTKERGTKKSPPAGKDSKITVQSTVEGVLTLANCLSSSIDTSTDAGSKVHAALIAAMAVKGDKGDDVVETMGDAIIALDLIWTAISDRYENIKLRKASLKAAAQAPAAAQAA